MDGWTEQVGWLVLRNRFDFVCTWFWCEVRLPRYLFAFSSIHNEMALLSIT